MTINNGDQVSLDVNQLTDKEVTVNWSQNLSSRSQQYYVVPIQKGGENSMVFIQKSYLDSFKGKLSGNNFTVDGSFQYGQKNQSGEGRWLAYHDKGQKPYQWRFVESMLSKLGNAGTELLNKIGLPIDLGILKNFLGDYLRNY